MKHILRISLFLFMLIILSLNAVAQGIDSSFKKQFGTFLNESKQEFNAFKDKNDSLFLEFLKNSWKEFEAIENPVPKRPKPVKQPVYQKSTKENPKSESNRKATNSTEKPTSKQDNYAPGLISPGKINSSGPISFYGNKILLPQRSIAMPVLTGISSASAAKYYADISINHDTRELFQLLKDEADQTRLNDWGLLLLLYNSSKSFYQNRSDQIAFTWAGMLQCGYNVKLGYDNNSFYLLVPSLQLVYTYSFRIKGKEYFLVSPDNNVSEPGSLVIHQADYPGNPKTINFQLNTLPQFRFDSVYRNFKYHEKKLEVVLNKNLINYLSHYPSLEISTYFNSRLSEYTLKQLDNFFLPHFTGKSNGAKLELLLSFVQFAIPYTTDEEQFGYEKYFFPEEVLFYPGADCEDRSAFFAELIRRYTPFTYIVLGYPGHVSVATATACNDGDDFVVIRQRKFFHTDPTFLGATCGKKMKGLGDSHPEIILMKE